MATAAQLRELRRKHGLGEFRKSGGSPNPSRRKKTRPRATVAQTVEPGDRQYVRTTMSQDVARMGIRAYGSSEPKAEVKPTSEQP